MVPLNRALKLNLLPLSLSPQIPTSRFISTSFLKANYHLQQQQPASPHHHRRTRRTFSISANPQYPRKDSQHKDSINPEATEYSKSGTDDESARQHEAAFDPAITDPQRQYEKAGEGRGDAPNPLDISPANPDVSEQKGDTTEHAGQGQDRERTSGGSSPKKGSKVA